MKIVIHVIDSRERKNFVRKFELITDPTVKNVKIPKLYSGQNHDFDKQKIKKVGQTLII